MSEREMRDKESDLVQLFARFTKFMWAMALVAFSAGAWTATQEIRLYINGKEDHEAHTEMHKISEWMVHVDATRYTLKDHNENQKVRSEERMIQEKRLQRLEDNQIKITETLKALDETLKRMD